MAFCDDTVYWPKDFLLHTILPLEDPSIGIVGTSKRAHRRGYGEISWSSFWNFIGCTYLCRRNFEQAASNTIDGQVSTVSGRSLVVRSEIVQDPAFTSAFLNEHIFFGKIGPLNMGEDKFLTNWIFQKGWKVRIQHLEEATIMTDLGTFPRYLKQCLRWSRTSWRNNFCRLCMEYKQLCRKPWSFYTIYTSSLINLAFFYDAAMLLTLYHGLNAVDLASYLQKEMVMMAFAVWIIATKVVKLIPHFKAYPLDIFYFPGYVLFAYYYSFQRLYAILTCWDVSWSSRLGVDDYEDH